MVCSSSPIKLVWDRLDSWKLRDEEESAEGVGGKGAEKQPTPPHSPTKTSELPTQYVGESETVDPNLSIFLLMIGRTLFVKLFVYVCMYVCDRRIVQSDRGGHQGGVRLVVVWLRCDHPHRRALLSGRQ